MIFYARPHRNIEVEVLPRVPGEPTSKARVSVHGQAVELDEYELHRLIVALAATRRIVHPAAEIRV